MNRIFAFFVLVATTLFIHATDVITSEGAWCWFADPRAIHFESADHSINSTYIGYIDVHGNVKATQIDYKNNRRTDVLVRSCFQPDDHNNPTFVVLPDNRVVIFYTRHTDEPRIWYRVSRKPGDITNLGDEHYLVTDHNTTYPSPFILSDDPQHIYMCWRGINWHPTIARITLPDANDVMKFDWGPHQIVQSTGARPYAKYQSNGVDKIYLTYTTGHPDNEWPCWLYFNTIDIDHGRQPKLCDIKGNQLSIIGEQTFRINKTEEYKSKYPFTLVDAPSDSRDWVWQIATDAKQQPVIALTHISQDKNSHQYLVAKWNGKKWNIIPIAEAGHAFHQSWTRTEKCYSGGMAIDPDNTDVIYASVPVNGVYEIHQYQLKPNGKIQTETPVTQNSTKNNIRPFVIANSTGTPTRLCWMNGDYYYWMANRNFPQGFPTSLMCDQLIARHNEDILFSKPDYEGETVQVDRNTILGVTADNHLYIRRGRTTHISPLLYLTSDEWPLFSNGTAGDSWPTRIKRADIRVTFTDNILRLYRNGFLELCITP